MYSEVHCYLEKFITDNYIIVGDNVENKLFYSKLTENNLVDLINVVYEVKNIFGETFTGDEIFFKLYNPLFWIRGKDFENNTLNYVDRFNFLTNLIEKDFPNLSASKTGYYSLSKFKLTGKYVNIDELVFYLMDWYKIDKGLIAVERDLFEYFATL